MIADIAYTFITTLLKLLALFTPPLAVSAFSSATRPMPRKITCAVTPSRAAACMWATRLNLTQRVV